MPSSTRTEPAYGPTNPSPAAQASAPVRRFGSVIGLKPGMEQTYRALHADVWPGVLDRLRRSNIRNYSIFVTEVDGHKLLFSYFEYTGTDLEADLGAIAEDPTTRAWWSHTDPCQIQLPTRKPGANWSDMEMVFLME